MSGARPTASPGQAQAQALIPELVPFGIDETADGTWDEIWRRFAEGGSLRRLRAFAVRLHARTANLEPGYVPLTYRRGLLHERVTDVTCPTRKVPVSVAK